MKLTHFFAYILAQLLAFSGMALGYDMGDTVIIQIGMACAVVVFMAYSIAEAVAAFYELPADEAEEDKDDGSDDRPREWD